LAYMRTLSRALGRSCGGSPVQSYQTLGASRETVDKSFFQRLSDSQEFLSGYPLKKIQENNEAEIMQVVLEEARSSYASEIVVELQSETMNDLESNIARIIEWIILWGNNQEKD